MLRTPHLTLLAALALAPALAHAQALPSTVQVTMPDGATLATDVWKPLFSSAKLPVLLRRTPYGRSVDFTLALTVANAGYVLVSQDVRGRGDSQGTFEPFFDDQVDGRATMEWIAKQDWSNGRIATYSNSAEGIVQFMAMGDAPEALRCAHLGMPTHDVYEGLFPGGAWRTDLGTNWLTSLGAADVVSLWKSHEVHDDYWKDATLTTDEMAHVHHPVFIIGGMFDIFAPSEVRALRELQTYAAPEARPNIFLILGPWTHGGVGLRGQGGLIFPEDTTYANWADELLAYVAWCTKDAERPDFPPVRYYQTEVTDATQVDPADSVERVVAQGSWLSSDTWPPPGSADKQLFFRATGDLGDAPSQGASIALPVDPAMPLPSLGGGNLTSAAGPFDQAQLDLMPGVFVATTKPVSEPTEIRGNVRVQLWAASATSDVDVIVRAEVLTAMGKVFALTDGVRRGRFLKGTDQRVPLVPGEPVRFDIQLGPMALKLSPGQSLRVAVSGTSSPRYEPNPNVADPLLEATPTSTTLTLYMDAEHPSELVVPVASGALPDARDAPSEDDTEVRDAGPRDDASAAQPAEDGGADGRAEDGDAGHMQPISVDIPAGCACRAAPDRAPPRKLGAISLSALVLWLAQRKRRRARATEAV